MARALMTGFLAAVLACFTLPAQSIDRLSLYEALASASKNNPDLYTLQKSIDLQKAKFWSGISPAAPTFLAEYEYIPLHSPIKNSIERKYEFSQTIEFPSTIVLKAHQLSKEEQLAEAEYAAAGRSIAAKVKTAYYTSLAWKARHDLSIAQASLADSFAQKAAIRLSVGEGTSLETLSARVIALRASNTLQSTLNSLQISLSELCLLIGKPAEHAPRLELTDSLATPVDYFVLQELVTQSVHTNPFIKLAEHRVDAASIKQSLAATSFLPSFSLSAARQSLDGNAQYYGVGIGISLPVWFLFDQRGQIEEASVHHAIAASYLRSTIARVSVSIQNAYRRWQDNRRQVDLWSSQMLPQAKEAFRMASISFNAGEISYVEYLQVQQLLFSTEETFIDALLEYHIALADLEEAAGFDIRTPSHIR